MNYSAKARRNSFSELEVRPMDDLVGESLSRKEIMMILWEYSISGKQNTYMKVKKKKLLAAVVSEHLLEWIDAYPITNEETKYEIIKDPKTERRI